LARFQEADGGEGPRSQEKGGRFEKAGKGKNKMRPQVRFWFKKFLIFWRIGAAWPLFFSRSNKEI
jgi:hypothetical protein